MRIASFFLLALTLRAETGRDAWLRYAPVSSLQGPGVVATLGDSVLIKSAQQELIRGVRGMAGRIPRAETGVPKEGGIVIGTLAAIQQAAPQWGLTAANLKEDGYWLTTVRDNNARYTVITAPNDRGLLYGTFALLRKMGAGDSVSGVDEQQSPSAPARWVNQWDNLDGTIERGYGGRSIFWEGGKVREDLSRVSEYGRLLASVGINGCSINNVNANPKVLSAEMIPQIARIAEAFRPWGVRVVLSIDFGSPQSVGGLDTYDPLDPKVIAWWQSTVDALYTAIPDLGGFVLKADSEGRVGPSTYGRTHADAANVVARALKTHGGTIFYRGFVYDHHMDWNNPKNDRGRAAYDNFKPLDGMFDDNVVIQIKNGPIDFQVREPASPLFAALGKTNEAIELQVTQEYMGQAKHTVFLVPMWKEALDFDMHVGDAATPVKKLIHGFAGVVNVGLDDNWFGNQLSQANLYGYGRLAFNPDLTAKQISDEWTRLTFGSDQKVGQVVSAIQLSSWRTYENYTGPLGLQTLTDITGNHYGVNVEASERNGWGQWHRADDKGVGMDRTVATGTGYIGQYPPAVARVYESLTSCPDDLLLFMHHVPYTQTLHSGKTVIQDIYDSHYEGAAAVETYVRQWESLNGLVDERRYQEILAQLKYQAGQAVVWRDAVTNWFFNASKIPDNQGRVGRYPGRIEAEAMKLEGYVNRDIMPVEDASGGKAITCPEEHCSASVAYSGMPGWYTLDVEYFDQNNGAAHYRVLVGDQVVDEWSGTVVVPSAKLDSTSSTRHTISGVSLKTGDQIKIEGVPERGESAAIDYIEITSADERR